MCALMADSTGWYLGVELTRLELVTPCLQIAVVASQSAAHLV
jgi:hypothetical protein